MELHTSSLCMALHTLQEHVLSVCFYALLVFPWTRVSARFLSRLYATIGGLWNAFAILSDLCSTGRCFLTILWMSGRCLEKVGTKGTLSSFFSLFFILRRSSRFSISTFCSCFSMSFPVYPLFLNLTFNSLLWT